jgi:hypothetical protein
LLEKRADDADAAPPRGARAMDVTVLVEVKANPIETKKFAKNRFFLSCIVLDRMKCGR